MAGSGKQHIQTYQRKKPQMTIPVTFNRFESKIDGPPAVDAHKMLSGLGTTLATGLDNARRREALAKASNEARNPNPDYHKIAGNLFEANEVNAASSALNLAAQMAQHLQAIATGKLRIR